MRIQVYGIATNKDGADDKLKIIPNGAVTCFEAGTSTPISMYDTEGAGSPAAQTTDADGNFAFWIEVTDANKRIKVVITKGGYSTVTLDDSQVVIDISGLTEKTTLVGDDLFLFQDSEDSNNYKKVKHSNVGDVPTKEIFFDTQNSTDGVGDVPVKSLGGAGGNNRVAIFFPDDFTSITEFYIWLIPGATGAAEDLDIESDYAADGEAFNVHSESDAASTYNLTTSQNFEFDISGIFSSPVAGDRGGVQLINNSGNTHRIVGAMLKYT